MADRWHHPKLQQRFAPLPTVDDALADLPTLRPEQTALLRNSLEMLREAPLQYAAVVALCLTRVPMDSRLLAREKQVEHVNVRMAKCRGMRFMRSQLGFWFDVLIDEVQRDDDRQN